MRDPWSTFRSLPWQDLLIAALVTMAGVYSVELLLGLALGVNGALRDLWTILFRPPLGMLFELGIAAGIGALSTLPLERLGKVYPSVANLWGYILTLAAALLIHDFLPGHIRLVGLSFEVLLLMTVGVFTRYRLR
jgi:hypothetical protein